MSQLIINDPTPGDDQALIEFHPVSSQLSDDDAMQALAAWMLPIIQRACTIQEQPATQDKAA